MRLFLLLFSLFMHFELLAKDIVKEFDLNKDGKIDRSETYRDKQLIEIARSTQFSGHLNFDEWISYFPDNSKLPKDAKARPIQIIKKDTNQDGKIDRIETYFKDSMLNMMIINIQVDTLFNGKFDKEWTVLSKFDQEVDTSKCDADFYTAEVKFLKLGIDIKNVQSKLEDGFYNTGQGYKIHQSCLDSWGAEKFSNLLYSSMNKGFQCLERLAEDNKKMSPNKPNGAYQNLKNFQHLLSKGDISVVCNEKKYSWKGINAHASSLPSQSIDELGVKAPFVSINPDYSKDKSKPPTQEELDNLEGTLFHEQFHNLGFRHTEGIEFAYACSDCCLRKWNPIKDQKEIQASCKVCSGTYSGVNDKEYVKDMINWGIASYDSKMARKAVIRFQEEFPTDRFGIFAYAYASSDVFSPVGIELSKILKTKFPNQSAEEIRILKEIDYHSNNAELKSTSKYSYLVAQAHFDLTYEQNPTAVLDALEKNGPAIKELVKLEKTERSNKKYMYKDIKEQLVSILQKIMMKGYPNNQNSVESARAHELLKNEINYF